MKVLTVVGARPQFVKLAPVSRALSGRVKEVIVHTGQHYDVSLSDLFFTELRLPTPAYNLNVGSGGHGAQTGRMLERLESVMLDERPDWLLVYGDTNSTLAAALCAAKLHVPVAHVEAGVRSYNRRMPEEVNRVLCDAISTLLFCPTECSMRNLASEGITAGTRLVGDVMFDAVRFNVELARPKQQRLLHDLNVSPKKYGVVTIHRAESTDDPDTLCQLLQALNRVAGEFPLIFPIHPRTKKRIEEMGGGQVLATAPNLKVVAPLGYLDMLALVGGAGLVVTDSGGLQKEAWFMHTPCVTLRTETEWVETLAGGANRLVHPGANVERELALAVSDALQVTDSAWAGSPFGDGDASEHIADALVEAGSR